MGPIKKTILDCTKFDQYLISNKIYIVGLRVHHGMAIIVKKKENANIVAWRRQMELQKKSWEA